MNLRTMRSLWGIILVSLGLLILIAGCGPAPERAPIKRTCAECHPDKAAKYQSGIVHSPVKEKNCEACHLPHGIVPAVVMRQQSPFVCLPCHAEFKEAGSKTSVHEPVNKGKCEVCHEDHNSQYPKLLKAAPEEVCFGCHDRKEFTRANVHAPVKQGCDTCHDAHMSDNPKLLKQPTDQLCASCHATGTPEFAKGHNGYPVTGDCVDCHAQHSSSGPKLLKEVVHEPMKEGDCDDCHQVQGNKISCQVGRWRPLRFLP